MKRVAGIDGTPGGWAVVIIAEGQSIIRKVAALSDIFDDATVFDIVAVDVPIGLLDAYEVGGRVCDRAARQFLGRPRGSSVFPAPVRPVLEAKSWEDACVRSRGSAANGKAVTKQTFAILPKIREVTHFSKCALNCARWYVRFIPKFAFPSWLACPCPIARRQPLDERSGEHSHCLSPNCI
jgi:predicted RNase H-like nuclease